MFVAVIAIFSLIFGPSFSKPVLEDPEIDQADTTLGKGVTGSQNPATEQQDPAPQPQNAAAQPQTSGANTGSPDSTSPQNQNSPVVEDPSIQAGQGQTATADNNQSNDGGAVAPNATSSKTQEDANAQASQAAVRDFMKNSVYNSFLCGAGYNYDRKTFTCVAAKPPSKAPSITPQSRQKTKEPDDATTTTTTTTTETSVEALDYSKENLARVDDDTNGFFPLECGMHYRYSEKDKVCQPVQIPKSTSSTKP